MKKYTVLVTAVGAIVGYGIIESLRGSGYDPHIIGTDIFDDAAGRYFSDEFAVAEPAASPAYPDFLMRLMDEKQIDLVLFGIEQEITAVFENRGRLKDYMARMALNPERVVSLSDDKWLTRGWLYENGLGAYAIDSVTGGGYEEAAARFGLPFLIKPRVSRGGKGIVTVSDPETYRYFQNRLGKNFMAQRIVGDAEQEYTVGVFGLGDGRFCNAIYLRRKLSQEGATAKAEVVLQCPALSEAAEKITSALRPEGPANYQFRMENGRAYLLEINPRISSSVSIRSRFGYNEAGMCIAYYLEGKVPPPAVIRPGRAVRYIKDWILTP